MKSYIYIPPSEVIAKRHVSEALKQTLRALPNKTFMRSWCSVAWLYPGLHPDGFEYRGSGWPKALKPLAGEAFRRRNAGTISDNELYPYQATKARIIHERKLAGLNA
jgi:hypothetical protein